MTLTELRNKADAKLVEFWDALITKQEAYFLKHKTFFGFNWTPANPVVDGADTDFGELQRPSRKHFAADVSFPTTEKLPFQIQVVRHHGAEHGFTATVRAELPNGRRFKRSRTAYPVVQQEVYEYDEEDNIIGVLTPLAITDWTIDTTSWEEIIEE